MPHVLQYLHGVLLRERHAAVLAEEREVLQVVLLDALVHVVDLSSARETREEERKGGTQ